MFDLGKAEKLLNSYVDFDAEFQFGLRRLTTFILETARNVGHTINIALVLKSPARIGSYARNLAKYGAHLVSDLDFCHLGSEYSMICSPNRGNLA